MRHVFSCLALLSTLVLSAAPALAEDSVTLKSVMVGVPNITIKYTKNFATCAHLLNDAGRMVHDQNNYCEANHEVTVYQHAADFLPGLAPVPGQQLRLCHGSNANVCSAYVTVLQEAVTLKSVTVAGPVIKVSYNKNFETCAHLSNNAGQSIHDQNNYCTTNSDVVLSQTPADFLPGKVPAIGQQLRLCHGNNAGICSAYVGVTVGAYAPTLTSFTPTEAIPGARVVIHGAYLDSVTSVTFNGVAAPGFTKTPSDINVTVPMGATTGRIAVSGPAGSAVSATDFTVQTISLVKVAAGSTGITTTYSKNYPGCVRLMNANNQVLHTSDFYCAPGSNITVTQNASAFLSGLAPVSGQVLRLCAATNYSVCSAPLTVTAVPEITNFSPQYAGPGSVVTISGAGFTGATAVSFNGLAAASFEVVSDIQVKATVPPQVGMGVIAIATPSGPLVSSTTLNIFRLTNLAPSLVFVDSLLTINLTPYLGTPTVKINGVPVTNIVEATASQIQVKIAPNTPPGNGIIDLRDSVKMAVHPTALTLTLLAKPTIAFFSPTAGGPGTLVTINGAGFRPDTQVRFGSLLGTQVNVLSSTAISAVVPQGVVAAPIEVFHNFGGTGGRAVSATSFQVAVAPALTSFSPEQEAEGAVITLVGRGFTGMTQVFFGPVSAVFTVDSDTSLRATVPVGAVNGPIRVVSAAGSALSATPFTVNPLCNPTINIQSELGITAIPVVNDIRTIFKPNDLHNSHWSFGYLMGRMAGADETDPQFQQKASAFVLAWLDLFRTATVTDNGAPIQPRPNINPAVVNSWPRLPGTTTLDFTRAPFRLLSIMNRLDLRNANQAGEGRFVFGVLTPNGGNKQFTVILEYRLPLTPALDQNAWARKWHELAPLGLGAPSYLAKLQEVTDLFSSNAFAGMPNGSAINQVRTNEIDLGPLWELREFKLPAAGGNLTEVTVKQTPVFSLNGSQAVKDWILANVDAVRDGTHQIPDRFTTGAPFLGGSAPMPFGFRWMNGSGLPEDVRRSFSLNTCNGCHSGETSTQFLHVNPRGPNAETSFSNFLQGDLTARATGPNGMRNLLIDLNCQ